MPCLVIIIAFFCPRLLLLFGWIFGFWAGAWAGVMWPILGFLVMPYTTIVYGLSHVWGNGLEGGWIVGVAIAALCDLGIITIRFATSSS